MHRMYWDWGHGPFGGGGFFMVVFWVCMAVLIVFVLKAILRGEPRQGGALEVLKRRYAAGEISKAEFEQIKKDLLE